MSYGSLRILRKYCRFYGINIDGELPHGWNPSFFNSLPEMILGSNGISRFNKNKTYYVARADQKEALTRDGYTNVHAIGLPIVYIKTKAKARLPGSLLIMPDHTLAERDMESRDLDYFNYLSNFRHNFSSVTLCVHRACADKKRWTKLSKLAEKVVIGGDPSDTKSLERVVGLMTAHEYMTTNEFGTHVAYAAYLGCKVSVGGPRPTFNASDMAKSTFYRNCGECLEMMLKLRHENTFAKLYPMFMTEPQAACKNEEWGRWEIGVQCKKTPAELRLLFGWHFNQVPLWVAEEIANTARRYSTYFRTTLNYLRFYGFVGLTVPFALRSARRKATRYTELPAKPFPFKIRNRSSDIDVVLQHYGRRELLDIRYPKNIKTILDLGANIGVSVMAFRSMFPDAVIIAVEMNAENFRLLRKNCSMDSLVTLENAAIWSTDGFVDQVDVENDAWALRVGKHSGKSRGKVTAFTFETILTKNELDHVDVCKMDIEGAELDVLTASWTAIFSKTKVLILEIHHWIPHVAEGVSSVIEEAKKAFNLEISHSGEFTVITNSDL